VAAFSGMSAMGWLRFWRVAAVVGHCGGCCRGWRLRHGDGEKEEKLGLGFLMV